jgi:hypothetical protein
LFFDLALVLSYLIFTRSILRFDLVVRLDLSNIERVILIQELAGHHAQDFEAEFYDPEATAPRPEFFASSFTSASETAFILLARL